MIKKNIVLILCFFYQITYGQVGNYAKVKKTYRDTYNFLEGESKGKQYKDKSQYVVYSDRDNNSSYLDQLGLKTGEKQRFLTPYFVIDETSDFLELVKFDPSVIGKPKGIFSFFYGKKYNFKDVKKASYVGWIQKDKLLHFSHSKVSSKNLKPIIYFLGIQNQETLFNLKKYIKKDSVLTYNDPNLKIVSKQKFNTNQLVYLYKYNSNKTAALISNVKHLQTSDSLSRKVGWVPSQLIKNIGQRKVLKINEDNDVLFSASDTVEYSIKKRDINNSVLFIPEDKLKKDRNILDTINAVSYVPLNVWDHYNNKLINVNGGDVYLREVPTIKKENKIFNFHFVFDCSPELKEKMILQISSLQRIWLLLNDDEQFKDFKFTFSASSYGCGRFYSFPKSDSFASWLDYLQKVFLNNKSIVVEESNSEGIQKCFREIKNKENEISFNNNIIIVVGENKLNINTQNNSVFKDLAKISSRVLFFQLANTTAREHQDFVLHAKQILENISNEYNKHITNYIIDTKLVVKQNIFTELASEEDNIYLYDAPKNSLYTGGIVFPRVNKNLTSVSLDLALDSVIKKTIKNNDAIVGSLEKGVDKLGFLRSVPTSRITNIITNDSIYNISLIPKNNKKEQYLETSRLNLFNNKNLQPGYLLSKDELENLIESYKSVVPLIDKNIDKKHRKKICKKYKSYYKQLNKILFYKQLKKDNTIGEMLSIKTGIQVKDSRLNSIKIKDISKKSKLSNKAYINLMQSLRSKILKLETVIKNPLTKTYIDGSNTIYYYVSNTNLF